MLCCLLRNGKREKFHSVIAMPTQVSHVPLKARKALCGRWTFLDVARSRELSFFRVGRESDFKVLREKVVGTTRKAFVNSPNDQPLDGFIQKELVPLLEAETAALPPDDLAREFVGELKRRVEGISCQRCSGSSGKVCCGAPDDDETVASGGECLAPIRALFEFARDSAVHYYRKFGTQIPEVGLPEVVLSTDYVRRKPHDVPVEFFVGGSTGYCDADGRPMSEVRLILWVEEFDWNTFLAALYVLFHECVSHAFQGITQTCGKGWLTAPSCALDTQCVGVATAAGREATGRDDAFSEGWMDHVAHELMSESLRDRAAPFPNAWLDAPDYLQTAGRFHAARQKYDLPSGVLSTDASEYAILCAEGVLAAQNFCSLFERVLECRTAAREAFFRISFDLNMLQAAQVRRQLTNLLAYRFRDYCRLRRNEQEDDLFLITAKYLSDNDIRAFLSRFSLLFQNNFKNSLDK
jgi:hypothetical protein